MIDADGCPVVNITVKASLQNNIRCILLCDTSHIFNIEGIETITVSKGADSADFRLVNLVEDGDLVITQDYGLAAMCLAKNAIVINQDGMRYTDENISGLLSIRHVNKKIRSSGGRVRGNEKRTKKQNDNFYETLSLIIKNNR